ncbi:hypothetical protein MMC13_006002 [Lambiella insularis]|nr:hypothetical protein [Lambiella insularis]
MEYRAHSSDGRSEALGQQQSTIVPSLHRVTWAEFKNKDVKNKDAFAVEVLMEELKYYDEFPCDGDRAGQVAALRAKHGLDNSIGDSQSCGQQIPESTPQHIRVNSLPVVSILSNIASAYFPTKPLVILKPCKMLVYYETGIRQALADLEMKWSGVERKGDVDAAAKCATEYCYPESPQDTGNGKERVDDPSILESTVHEATECLTSEKDQVEEDNRTTSKYEDPRSSLEALRGVSAV